MATTTKKGRRNGSPVSRREFEAITSALEALFDSKFEGHQAWLAERFRRSDEATNRVGMRVDDLERARAEMVEQIQESGGRWKVVAAISAGVGALIMFLGALFAGLIAK